MHTKIILTLLSPAVLLSSACASQSPWQFSDTYINGRHIAQMLTEGAINGNFSLYWPADKYVPMHSLEITKTGNRTDIRIKKTIGTAEYLTLSPHEGGVNVVVDELIRLEAAAVAEEHTGYERMGLAVMSAGKAQNLSSPRFEINCALNQSGGPISLAGKTFNLRNAFMHTPDKITIKPLDIDLPLINSMEIEPLRFSYEGKILPGAYESYGCMLEGELDFTACSADLKICNASFALHFNRDYMLRRVQPPTKTRETFNLDRRFAQGLRKAFS